MCAREAIQPLFLVFLQLLVQFWIEFLRVNTTRVYILLSSPHSIVNGGFGLQESLSRWTYTLFLLIEVRHLYLSLPLLVHVVFTYFTYCEVLLCRSTNSEMTKSLSFGLTLTKQPFQEQSNWDLESSPPFVWTAVSLTLWQIHWASF